MDTEEIVFDDVDLSLDDIENKNCDEILASPVHSECDEPTIKESNIVVKPKKTTKKRLKLDLDELSEEEREKIEIAHFKIDQMYEMFPDELAPIKKPRGYTTWKSDQLEEFYEKLDKVVGSGDNHDFVRNTYLSLCRGVEVVSSKGKFFKLQGFSDAVAQSPVIDKTLKRLEVRYLSDMSKYMCPEAVLISCTGMTAFAVHQKNVNEEKIQKVLTKPIDNKLVNKYSNL